MDWNLFWNAFGAIGTTVGALATAIAVIVALWQTKISYKKKIKLSFSDNIVVVPENGQLPYKSYIGITVTNIGNREIVINNWGFNLHDGTKLLIVPDRTHIGRLIHVQLPHRLLIEESITLYYDKQLFLNTIKECLDKGTIKIYKKLVFYVTDSISKEHTIIIKKSINELLLNEDKTKPSKICV